MPNGYCAPLLKHITAVIGSDPARRLEIMGFTEAVLKQTDPVTQAQIEEQFANGHQKNVTVYYDRRPLPSEVKTAPECGTPNFEARQEFEMPGLLYRQHSFYLELDRITRYCEDASKYVTVVNGLATMTQQTPIMNEVYNKLLQSAGVVMTSMNAALISQAVTAFGMNVNTGDNNARSLTFSLNTSSPTDAYFSIMKDLEDHQVQGGGYTMVGNGVFAAMGKRARSAFSNGTSAAGLNKAAIMNDLSMSYDPATSTYWGANNIALIERGAMALVTYPKYVGNFAIDNFGTSDFTNLMLPVSEFETAPEFLKNLQVDVQIKKYDCATTINLNGTPTSVKPGVEVIVSKDFGLFTRPTTLFKDGDRLEGVNGIWRYDVDVIE